MANAMVSRDISMNCERLGAAAGRLQTCASFQSGLARQARPAILVVAGYVGAREIKARILVGEVIRQTDRQTEKQTIRQSDGWVEVGGGE